jgi:hypothetical protein
MTPLSLTQISASNIKGQTFSHDLAPVTIFMGDNRAGKSARLAAIRLLVLGFEPKLGTLPSRSMKLCRPSQHMMSVSGQLSDGSTGKREFHRKGDNCSALPPTIPAGLGSIPIVLLDPREFFALKTGDMRRRYLVSACKIDGEQFTAAAVVAELKNIKLDHNTEQSETVLQELGEWLFRTAASSARDQADWFQTWLNARLEDIKDKLRTAKADLDRMRKSVVATSQLQSTETPPPPSANVRETLAKQRSDQQDLATGLRITSECIKMEEVLITRRQKLETLIAEAVDPSNQILGLEKQLLEARDKVMSYKSDTDAIVARGKALRQQADSKQSDSDQLRERMRVRSAKHAELMEQSCCPTCKADNTDWQKIIRADYIAWLAEQQQLIDALSQQTLELNQQIDNLKASHKLATAEDAKIASARHLCVQIEARLAILKLSQQGILTAQTELRTLGAPIDLTALREKLTKEEADLAVSTATVKATDELLARSVAAEQDELRKKQAGAEMATAKVRKDVLDAAVQVFTAFQSQMIETVFGKVIRTANQIAQSFITEGLAYDNGDIGYYSNGDWIDYTTFSGLEEVLTYVALSVALSPDCPLKLILLDEMGNLTPQNQRAVCQHAVALVKQGIITQFIGVIAGEPMMQEIPEVEIIGVTKTS